MDKALIFGASALVVNLIGYIPYIKGIFDGLVKPQRITWGIWSILTFVGFINQGLNGGGYSTYFFGSTTALVFIVFVLSFRKGVGGGSSFANGHLYINYLPGLHIPNELGNSSS